MSTYFKYGNYQHDAGEVYFFHFKQYKLVTPRGGEDIVRKQMQIMGEIKETSPAAFVTKINALETAYNQQNQDAGLYYDDDTAIHVMYSVPSRNGTEVKLVEYPKHSGGTELATGRTYSIVIEAEYTQQLATPLVDWSDSMHYVGTGGAEYTVIENEVGPPDHQPVAQQTRGLCIHTGFAINSAFYQSPAQQLFPTYSKARDVSIKYTSPETQRWENQYYRTDWSYRYEAPFGLGGQFPITR